MAGDKKITQLSVLTVPAADDQLVIIDQHDDSLFPVTKQIAFSAIVAAIQGQAASVTSAKLVSVVARVDHRMTIQPS